MTDHDLGDGYSLRVSPVYGDFRATLHKDGVLIAQASGLMGSQEKAVRWGVRAKHDHQRSIAIAARPHLRSWRQRLLG